jgi:hypothetical protein
VRGKHLKTPIWTLAAILFAAILGCSSGRSGSPTLNPAFGKTWTGTTTIRALGLTPTSYAGQLTVAVSGDSATVTKVCPDGSGAVSSTGSGNTINWTGNLACPPIAVQTCSAVTFTYSSATLTLSADGSTLTAEASGQLSGCGGSTSITASFVGT